MNRLDDGAIKRMPEGTTIFPRRRKDIYRRSRGSRVDIFVGVCRMEKAFSIID
jgi:hypothetical protein